MPPLPDPTVHPLLEVLATMVERFDDWPPSGANADRREAVALADAARDVVTEYRQGQAAYRLALDSHLSRAALEAVMGHQPTSVETCCPKCNHSDTVPSTVRAATCTACDTTFSVRPPNDGTNKGTNCDGKMCTDGCPHHG